MGFFGKAEKKLEGAVMGVFTRAFKGDVQPVEITHRLQRELDTEAQILARDKRLVPNDFVVGLSKHDYARLFPYSKTLNAEMMPELRSYAADRAYVFNGPLRIRYEERPDIPTGRIDVASQATAEVGGSPASTTQIRTAALLLEVNGVRHPITPGGLVIGRGSEADLRINDPGISRRHAEIVLDDAGTVRIRDLGSTNGILVDGEKVAEATLAEGSRIDIGKTRMVVVAHTGE